MGRRKRRRTVQTWLLKFTIDDLPITIIIKVLVGQVATRGSTEGRKSAARTALDCARRRANLELEGGERRMEQLTALATTTTASVSSCSSSCCDSWRLKAMASAVNCVKSLVLLFLEAQRGDEAFNVVLGKVGQFHFYSP